LLLAEIAYKVYFSVPAQEDGDQVKWMMGSWGQTQGFAGLLLLGVVVLPNCDLANTPGSNVNCIDGETVNKEVLILIGAAMLTYFVQLGYLIFSGRAVQLGLNTCTMYPWFVFMGALGLFAILAATDAATISKKEDGEDKYAFFMIFVIAINFLTALKTVLTKVEHPKDAPFNHGIGA
jgi:hypothetical protein